MPYTQLLYLTHGRHVTAVLDSALPFPDNSSLILSLLSLMDGGLHLDFLLHDVFDPRWE